MPKSAPFSIQVPYQDQVSDSSSMLTVPWQKFFEVVRDALDPLGREQVFSLVNNQASPISIEGMLYSNFSVSFVWIDYGIQRVTTSTGAVESVEQGTFTLAYKPTSNSWVLSSGPSIAGVTLSVLATGQVQYVTTNITGTASISKIVWRSRTLAAKNSLYSKAGR